MAYTALKPCTFAGQTFKIGEIVPDELIHPENVNNLVKMGKIAVTGDSAYIEQPKQATASPDFVSVDVKAEEGTITLEVTKNGVQAIFDVLTCNVSEAEQIINEMTDNDALILLHLSDSRKAIKAAAETRAKEINGTEEPTETGDE